MLRSLISDSLSPRSLISDLLNPRSLISDLSIPRSLISDPRAMSDLSGPLHRPAATSRTRHLLPSPGVCERERERERERGRERERERERRRIEPRAYIAHVSFNGRLFACASERARPRACRHISCIRVCHAGIKGPSRTAPVVVVEVNQDGAVGPARQQVAFPS